MSVLSDELKNAILDEDFYLANDILERIKAEENGESYINDLMEFMSENPALDYGMPGPIIHFIESYGIDKYIDTLLELENSKPMGRIQEGFCGTASELPIEEYLKDADVIVIEFKMYYGSELYYPRRITLDLKNKKIYYATQLFFEYTDADKCADLSDEDVQSIRDELPKHISDNQGDVTEYNLDYTFEIMMKTPDYKNKGYRGNSGDEINFSGFDAYWKELYKKSFGEEFVFEK